MQLYDIAVGNEMIRPYLLSVECAAAPQPLVVGLSGCRDKRSAVNTWLMSSRDAFWWISTSIPR